MIMTVMIKVMRMIAVSIAYQKEYYGSPVNFVCLKWSCLKKSIYMPLQAESHWSAVNQRAVRMSVVVHYSLSVMFFEGSTNQKFWQQE